MSNTAITAKHLDQLESRKARQTRNHSTYGLAFHVISSVLLIVAGISMFKLAGFYDSMDSTAGKITLCAVISYCYLTAFRRGLFSGKR